MAIVSSIAELQMEMMRQVKEIMDKSVLDLEDEIKESIDKVVYEGYKNPHMRYDRTNTLKNSLSQTGSSLTARNASITIGHDPSQMDYFSVKDNSRRMDIPEIVTGQKKYGTFKGRGVYAYGGDYHDINPSKGIGWSKPRDYIAHAEQKLEGYGYLRKCLENHLPPHITIV